MLLLDEIEKAHPDLFNILLQVMDYGKLTDHNGKNVDFRNVILIMTTNAGAADMAKPAMGFGSDERVGEDEEAINRLFSNDLGPLRAVRDLGLGLVDRMAPLKKIFVSEAAGDAGGAPRLLRGEPV